MNDKNIIAEKQVVESGVSSVKLSNIDWRKFLNINEISRYVDSHYSEFKTGIYIIAGTGIILTFRSLRLFSKFKTVRQIPDSFFRKQVKLQGFVRAVEGGENATLKVEHIPIVEMSFHKGIKELLPVRLAGLGSWSEPAASRFVAERVLNKKVTFQLVEEGPKEAYLVAAVQYRPYAYGLKHSLNVDVVEKGLAPFIFDGSKFDEVLSGTETKPKTIFKPQPVEYKLAAKLMEAQRKAQNKHLGIWEVHQPEDEESAGKSKGFSASKALASVAKVPASLQVVSSSLASVSGAIRSFAAALIFFPAKIKDKILQRRSIS